MPTKITRIKHKLFAKRKNIKIDSVVGPKDDIDVQGNYEERKSGLLLATRLDLRSNWVDLTRKFKLNTN